MRFGNQMLYMYWWYIATAGGRRSPVLVVRSRCMVDQCFPKYHFSVDSSDAIARSLRDNGAMTRHDMVSATGLSLSTVNRALTALIAAGTVAVVGNEAPAGGRPPVVFELTGDDRLVAGVSITAEGATALVSSPAGAVVARHRVEFGRGDDPEATLKITLGLMDDLRDAHVARVGVAVPGVVTGKAGTVSAIHELEWENLALGDLLSRQVGRPVTLANDADCLAVAEHRRGAGRGVDNMVAFVVGDGLGAGIITNGQLYRGQHNEAGEVGYLLTERRSLRRLFPHRGELEQLTGNVRLRAEAARLGLPDPGRATIMTVISAGAGVAAARELVDELLDLVALAVLAMCVVLDPELVVIGGVADTTPLISGVRQRLLGRILRVPRIEPAALGADAIMVGAAQMALGAPVGAC